MRKSAENGWNVCGFLSVRRTELKNGRIYDGADE